MKTVIIIEDDPCYTYILKNKFGNEYDCHCFESIADFETNGTSLLPSVVLIDYYLPDGHAPSLIKKLKSKFMSLPILAMSVSEDDSVRKNSIEAGGSYFFNKGQVILDELLWKIRMLEGRI